MPEPIVIDPRAIRMRDRMFKKYGAALIREKPRSAKSKVDAIPAVKEPRYCIEGIGVLTETPILNKLGEIIVFAPTAFDKYIANNHRPDLWLSHDNTKIVGSGIELCGMNVGVAFRMALSDERYAAIIKQMVESKTRDSISIGFTEIKVRDKVYFGHKVRYIEEAEIREVSLVPVGACRQAFARIIDANNEPPLEQSVSSDMFAIEYDLHNIHSIRKDNDLSIEWLQQRLAALEAGASYHGEQPASRPMTMSESNRLHTEWVNQMQSERRAMLRLM
jgi:HK97 family phage prohead protease